MGPNSRLFPHADLRFAIAPQRTKRLFCDYGREGTRGPTIAPPGGLGLEPLEPFEPLEPADGFISIWNGIPIHAEGARFVRLYGQTSVLERQRFTQQAKANFHCSLSPLTFTLQRLFTPSDE